MSRTAGRTLELLSLLRSADRWNGPDLAARLGTSIRTLRRDVETLRSLGYAVEASGGRTSTYRLGRGTPLPPLLVDEEEAVAVSVALQTSPVTVLGLRDAAERALASLRGVMPPALRAQVDRTRVTTVPNQWEFGAPPLDPAVLRTLGEAVRSTRAVRADRLRTDGSRPDPRDPDFVAPFWLEPPHLAVWAGRWYVVGREHGGAEWLVVRADRLHLHSGSGRTFERRPLTDGEVVDLVVTCAERGDVVADWPCRGSAVLPLPAEVVARFAPGGSVVEPLGDRRARLGLGAWSWAGVAGLLATFDADLDEVEPAELRAAFGVLSDRMAAASAASLSAPRG